MARWAQRTMQREQVKLFWPNLDAMNADLAKLETIALDATQVKANSSRHNTATAETIKERLARLDQMIERMLSEAEEANGEDRRRVPRAGRSYPGEALESGLRPWNG
jgi:hypothetical protein